MANLTEKQLISQLKGSVFWEKGKSPFIIKKRLEVALTQDIPNLLNEALNTVAQKTLIKLQTWHKTSFSSKSSGLSYKTIIKFSREKNIDIFPGKISKVNVYHVGYYPNYFRDARQLAPKHQVQDYMQYLNAGVAKGMIKATSPGVAGSMSRGGQDRLRVWADIMGLAQGARPYTVQKLKKRHESRVGRPAKYREYTYQANPQRQLWMIIKGMEKRGIPGKTFGRGKYHLDQFANYLNKGIDKDITEAFGKAKREFERAKGKRGIAITIPEPYIGT